MRPRGPATIAVIVGIRSHYVKVAGLALALDGKHALERADFQFVNAGQHYDWELSRQYAEEYGLSFDTDITGRLIDKRPHFLLGAMIGELEEHLRASCDIRTVVVFGDANASLAGAIAARRAGKTLVHVEAGLRTADRANPEELNRRLIDTISDLHIASCLKDLGNLEAEGRGATAFMAGDLVKDLVLAQGRRDQMPTNQAFICIHRKENIQDIDLIENALTALLEAGLQPTVLAHPAVLTQVEMVAQRHGAAVRGSLSHQETLKLVASSRVGITDSGALQREGYYLRRRLLIRQDHPFWSSLTDAGFHLAVGRSKEAFAVGVRWALEQPEPSVEFLTEFGDGRAGPRILDALRTLQATTETRLNG